MKLLWLALIALSACLVTEAQTRRAFVVGVGEYDEIHDLPRTISDAEGYAEAFGLPLDFEVTKLIDPTFDEFFEQFASFLETIEPDDQVAFVFSGHGWSDGTQNYLALKDAPLQSSEFRLKRLTAALNRDILDELRQRDPSLVLAIIDACRDNPFDLGTKSVSKGLIPQQTVPGTLVVYAAGANERALERLSPEDTSPYSLFTRTFLPKLSDPSKPLMRTVDEARDETERWAQTIRHQQRPAVYSDISIDFCFAQSCPQLTEALNDEKARSNELLANLLAASAEQIFAGERGGDHARSMLMSLYANKLAQFSHEKFKHTLIEAISHHALMKKFEPLPTEKIITEHKLVNLDGEDKFIVAFYDGSVELQDLNKRKRLRTIRAPDEEGPRVSSIEITSDGRMAFVTGSIIEIWDLSSWSEVKAIETGDTLINSLAFSADGKRMVSNGFLAKVWDVASGDLLLEVGGAKLHNHGYYSNQVKDVALSPDGSTLFTAMSSNSEHHVEIWDVNKQTLVEGVVAYSEIDYRTDLTGIAVNESGSEFATGDNKNRVLLWKREPENTRVTKELSWFTDKAYPKVASMEYSPLGDELIVAFPSGITRVLDSTTGSVLQTIGGQGSATQANYIGESGLISTSGDGAPQEVWRAKNGRLRDEFQLGGSFLTGADLTTDGRFMALSGFTSGIQIWDLHSQKIIHQIGRTILPIRGIALSDDGTQFVLIGQFDPWIGSVGSTNQRKLSGHDGRVVGVAASSDFTRLITHSQDGTAKLWRSSDGELLNTFSSDSENVQFATISKDGSTVAIGWSDGRLNMWNTETGTVIQEFERQHGKWDALSLSADGNLLASLSIEKEMSSNPEWNIKIWSSSKSSPLREIDHDGAIHDLDLSASGELLATSGSNPTGFVWDTASGSKLQTIGPGNGSSGMISISGDGNSLVAAGPSTMGHAQLWDTSLTSTDWPRLIQVACDILVDLGSPIEFSLADLKSEPAVGKYLSSSQTTLDLSSPCISALD